VTRAQAQHPTTRAKPRWDTRFYTYANTPHADDGDQVAFEAMLQRVQSTLRSWGFSLTEIGGPWRDGTYTRYYANDNEYANWVSYEIGEHAGLWTGQFDGSVLNSLFDPRRGYVGYGRNISCAQTTGGELRCAYTEPRKDRQRRSLLAGFGRINAESRLPWSEFRGEVMLP
jgi:hypothetical protein